MINDSIMDMEPNIVKAKFIITETRIYTLEFDQNIEMKELKIMIRVAASIKNHNFRLFCEGKEYTDYNQETFESLFPNQHLVVFTIHIGEGQILRESELLLQINSPCPHHSDKFLLFYCFDCGCSICCDCFTIGIHKGHHIQDKCYYLLPSKFLVQKMFESWSNNPYQDYKIGIDLTDYKNKINIYFEELFKMLNNIKGKCIELIDLYNNINLNSVESIRNSVRDIKVNCIIALDKLKDKINIKDIVNNPQIFKEFDTAYKKLKKAQNEQFKKNLENFAKLNKEMSKKIIDLINITYNNIKENLKLVLNCDIFEKYKIQIANLLINPVDKNTIINFDFEVNNNLNNSNNLPFTQAIYNGILNVSNNNLTNTSSTMDEIK